MRPPHGSEPAWHCRCLRVTVSGLESEYVQILLSLVYMCIIVGDPAIKRGCGISLTGNYRQIIVLIQALNSLRHM